MCPCAESFWVDNGPVMVGDSLGAEGLCFLLVLKFFMVISGSVLALKWRGYIKGGGANEQFRAGRSCKAFPWQKWKLKGGA